MDESSQTSEPSDKLDNAVDIPVPLASFYTEEKVLTKNMFTAQDDDEGSDQVRQCLDCEGTDAGIDCIACVVSSCLCFEVKC